MSRRNFSKSSQTLAKNGSSKKKSRRVKGTLKAIFGLFLLGYSLGDLLKQWVSGSNLYIRRCARRAVRIRTDAARFACEWKNLACSEISDSNAFLSGPLGFLFCAFLHEWKTHEVIHQAGDLTLCNSRTVRKIYRANGRPQAKKKMRRRRMTHFSIFACKSYFVALFYFPCQNVSTIRFTI